MCSESAEGKCDCQAGAPGGGSGALVSGGTSDAASCGSHRCLLYYCLQTRCTSPSSARHTPSRHLQRCQSRCPGFAAMDRLCLPASAPSGPPSPAGWLVYLCAHRPEQGRAHAGSTFSDAFSVKTMSSLKARTTRSEEPLADGLRLKSWGLFDFGFALFSLESKAPERESVRRKQ